MKMRMKTTTIRIGGADLPVLEFLHNNYICVYQLQGCHSQQAIPAFERPVTHRLQGH
jgi:hypothetical protein